MAHSDLTRRSAIARPGGDNSLSFDSHVFVQLEMPNSRPDLRDLFGCQLAIKVEDWVGCDLELKLKGNKGDGIVGTLLFPTQQQTFRPLAHLEMVNTLGRIRHFEQSVDLSSGKLEHPIPLRTVIKCLHVERHSNGKVWLVRGEVLSGGVIFQDSRIFDDIPDSRDPAPPQNVLDKVIWPIVDEKLRGIFFTGTELQIEVSKSSNQIRRFRLLGVNRNDHGDVQDAIWEHIAGHEFFSERQYDEVIRQSYPRGRISQDNRHFLQPNDSVKLRLAEIESRCQVVGVEVLGTSGSRTVPIVHVTDMDQPVSNAIEFYKIDFSLVFDKSCGFSEHSEWRPRTLAVSKRLITPDCELPATEVVAYVFSDVDEVDRILRTGKSSFDVPSQPTAVLTWTTSVQSVGIDPCLPDTRFVGSADQRSSAMARDLWFQARANSTSYSESPASWGHMSAVESPADPARNALRETRLSGPFRFAKGMTVNSKWITSIAPALVDGDADSAPASIELIIPTTGGSATLQFSRPNVTVDSPPFNFYSEPINDPKSVPNERQPHLPSRTRKDSLRFVYRPDSKRERPTKTNYQSNRPESFVRCKYDPSKKSFLVRHAPQAAELYLPAAHALIDPVSVTRGNLVAKQIVVFPLHALPDSKTPGQKLHFIELRLTESGAVGELEIENRVDGIPHLIDPGLVGSLGEYGGFFVQLTPSPNHNLHLMSVSTTDELVSEGRSLVVAAIVAGSVHVRIFNANGDQVVDKTESELTAGAELTELNAILEADAFPNLEMLSTEQVGRIIHLAMVVSDHPPSVDATATVVARLLPEPKPSVHPTNSSRLHVKVEARNELEQLKSQSAYTLMIGPTRLALPRDVNHGLIPIGIQEFWFKDVEDSLPILGFEQTSVRGSESQSVFALHPWTEWGPDPKDWITTGRARLHHRNLIQEHAEFESSFEDRFPPEGPAPDPTTGQIPSPLLPLGDHLRAVRDRYTEASGNLLPGAPQGVRNWLSHSELTGSDGKALTPEVEFDLSGDLPLTRLNAPEHAEVFKEQALKLRKADETGAELHWLDASIRVKSLKVGSRPKLEVVKSDGIDPISQRAIDSSVPLLFSRHDISALAFIEVPGPENQTVVIAGGPESEAIAYLFSATGVILHRVALQPITNKPMLDVGLQRHGDQDSAVIRGLAVTADAKLKRFVVKVIPGTGGFKLEISNVLEVALRNARVIANAPQDKDATFAVLDHNGAVHVLVRDDARPIANLSVNATAVSLVRNANDALCIVYGDSLGKAFIRNIDGSVPIAIDLPARVKANEILGQDLNLDEIEKLEMSDPAAVRSIRILSLDNEWLVVACDGSRFISTWGFVSSAPKACRVWLQSADTLSLSLGKVFDFEQRGTNDVLDILAIGTRSGELRASLVLSNSRSVSGLADSMRAQLKEIQCFDAATAPVIKACLPSHTKGRMAPCFVGTSAGTVKSWDLRSGIEWPDTFQPTNGLQEQQKFAELQPTSFYDGLGVVREISQSKSSNPNLVIEKLSIGTEVFHSISAPAYRLTEPLPPGQKQTAEGLTEFILRADAFKVRQDGLVDYIQFPDGEFNPGRFGCYSTITAAFDKPELGLIDHLPRIAGIPFFVTGIREIKVIENPADIASIELEGVLINPDEMAAGQDPADAGTILGIVARDLSRNSIVRIKFAKEATGWNWSIQDSNVDWTLAVNRQLPDPMALNGIPGRIARIVGKLEKSTANGLYLKVDLPESQAHVFGRLWPFSSGALAVFANSSFVFDEDKQSWRQSFFEFRTDQRADERLAPEQVWKDDGRQANRGFVNSRTYAWDGYRHLVFHNLEKNENSQNILRFYVADRTTGWALTESGNILKAPLAKSISPMGDTCVASIASRVEPYDDVERSVLTIAAPTDDAGVIQFVTVPETELGNTKRSGLKRASWKLQSKASSYIVKLSNLENPSIIGVVATLDVAPSDNFKWNNRLQFGPVPSTEEEPIKGHTTPQAQPVVHLEMGHLKDGAKTKTLAVSTGKNMVYVWDVSTVPDDPIKPLLEIISIRGDIHALALQTHKMGLLIAVIMDGDLIVRLLSTSEKIVSEFSVSIGNFTGKISLAFARAQNHEFNGDSYLAVGGNSSNGKHLRTFRVPLEGTELQDPVEVWSDNSQSEPVVSIDGGLSNGVPFFLVGRGDRIDVVTPSRMLRISSKGESPQASLPVDLKMPANASFQISELAGMLSPSRRVRIDLTTGGKLKRAFYRLQQADYECLTFDPTVPDASRGEGTLVLWPAGDLTDNPVDFDPKLGPRRLVASLAEIRRDFTTAEIELVIERTGAKVKGTTIIRSTSSIVRRDDWNGVDWNGLEQQVALVGGIHVEFPLLNGKLRILFEGNSRSLDVEMTGLMSYERGSRTVLQALVRCILKHNSDKKIIGLEIKDDVFWSNFVETLDGVVLVKAPTRAQIDSLNGQTVTQWIIDTFAESLGVELTFQSTRISKNTVGQEWRVIQLDKLDKTFILRLELDELKVSELMPEIVLSCPGDAKFAVAYQTRAIVNTSLDKVSDDMKKRLGFFCLRIKKGALENGDLVMRKVSPDRIPLIPELEPSRLQAPNRHSEESVRLSHRLKGGIAMRPHVPVPDWGLVSSGVRLDDPLYEPILGKMMLLEPVVSIRNGALTRLRQDGWLERVDEIPNLVTDGLFVLNADSIDPGFEAIVGLEARTQFADTSKGDSTGGRLRYRNILRDTGAQGIAIHYSLDSRADGRPSNLGFIDSPFYDHPGANDEANSLANYSANAKNSIRLQTTFGLSTQASRLEKSESDVPWQFRIDPRLLAPHEIAFVSSSNIVPSEHRYSLAPLPVDANRDVCCLAHRHYRLSRLVDGDLGGKTPILHVAEIPAFRQPARLTTPGKKPWISSKDGLERRFFPPQIDWEIAADKPGAMFQILAQARFSDANGTSSHEPQLDFAIREPQFIRLAKCVTAAVEWQDETKLVVDGHRLDATLVWKEIVGSVEVADLATDDYLRWTGNGLVLAKVPLQLIFDFNSEVFAVQQADATVPGYLVEAQKGANDTSPPQTKTKPAASYLVSTGEIGGGFEETVSPKEVDFDPRKFSVAKIGDIWVATPEGDRAIVTGTRYRLFDFTDFKLNTSHRLVEISPRQFGLMQDTVNGDPENQKISEYKIKVKYDEEGSLRELKGEIFCHRPFCLKLSEGDLSNVNGRRIIELTKYDDENVKTKVRSIADGNDLIDASRPLFLAQLAPGGSEFLIESPTVATSASDAGNGKIVHAHVVPYFEASVRKKVTVLVEPNDIWKSCLSIKKSDCDGVADNQNLIHVGNANTPEASGVFQLIETNGDVFYLCRPSVGFGQTDDYGIARNLEMPKSNFVLDSINGTVPITITFAGDQTDDWNGTSISVSDVSAVPEANGTWILSILRKTDGINEYGLYEPSLARAPSQINAVLSVVKPLSEVFTPVDTIEVSSREIRVAKYCDSPLWSPKDRPMLQVYWAGRADFANEDGTGVAWRPGGVITQLYEQAKQIKFLANSQLAPKLAIVLEVANGTTTTLQRTILFGDSSPSFASKPRLEENAEKTLFVLEIPDNREIVSVELPSPSSSQFTVFIVKSLPSGVLVYDKLPPA